MNARMKHPVLVIPGALDAMLAVSKTSAGDHLPKSIRTMVHLRTSQINGCGVCVEMHARELRKLGESNQRIDGLAAWREMPYFSDAERAALALAECGARLSDRADAAPDDVWAEAARHFDARAMASLVIEIGQINAWNRLNVLTRQIAGTMG